VRRQQEVQWQLMAIRSKKLELLQHTRSVQSAAAEAVSALLKRPVTIRCLA